MKRFNYKNPGTQKWFLVSGLMIALGFSLSWNPQNTQIARFERAPHLVEFASNADPHPGKEKDDKAADTAPAKTEEKVEGADTQDLATEGPRTTYESFNLQTVNSSFCNANVKFALDRSESGDQQKVVFSVEGDVCTTCDKIGSVLINMKNVQDNMAAIQLSIAQEAAKICKKTDGKKDHDGKKTARITDDDTECDLEDDLGDLLSCQQDELTAMADSCEEIDTSKDLSKEARRENKKEKAICEKRVKNYFNKFLAKSIRKGLSDSDQTSEAYQNALAARDSLIEDLPKKFDDSIRTSLVALTTNAVYDQTKTFYNSCLADQNCAAGNSQFATTKAQMFMNNQISAMGNPLWATLSYYGEDNDSSQAMLNLFKSQYAEPLQTFWNKSVSSKSLDLSATSLIADSSGLATGPLGKLGIDVSTEATNGQTDARGNLRLLNASGVPVIPEAFGTSTNNGTPALMQSGGAPAAADTSNGTPLNLRAPQSL